MKAKNVSKKAALILFSRPNLWRKTSIERSYDVDGFGIDFKKVKYPYYQHLIFKDCYSKIHYEGQPKSECVRGFVEHYNRIRKN